MLNGLVGLTDKELGVLSGLVGVCLVLCIPAAPESRVDPGEQHASRWVGPWHRVFPPQNRQAGSVKWRSRDEGGETENKLVYLIDHDGMNPSGWARFVSFGS